MFPITFDQIAYLMIFVNFKFQMHFVEYPVIIAAVLLFGKSALPTPLFQKNNITLTWIKLL